MNIVMKYINIIYLIYTHLHFFDRADLWLYPKATTHKT
uniref:Uncharacterized protein n=1 Tax=Anguilla anguilla TaxID=7936 RepID=A0A0E9QD55_ANGAN